MANNMLSIVVNYFNPRATRRIDAMTELALEHLAAYTKVPFELILTDGSGVISSYFQEICADRGWIYAPSSAKEGFAAAYNRGARLATGTHIVWMANDIFVQAEWDTRLLQELQRTGAWMAAPYLSYSDYWGQVRGRAFRASTFHPSFLTFNLNMMTRECWNRIGPMDEQFSGSFNDIDYMMRIRAAGGDVVIAEAGNISHIGRATLRLGTDVNWVKDVENFYAKYPTFRRNCGFLGMDPICCKSWTYRTLLAMTWKVPVEPVAEFLREMVCRCEPLFHAYRRWTPRRARVAAAQPTSSPEITTPEMQVAARA